MPGGPSFRDSRRTCGRYFVTVTADFWKKEFAPDLETLAISTRWDELVSNFIRYRNVNLIFDYDCASRKGPSARRVGHDILSLKLVIQAKLSGVVLKNV